MKGGQHHNQPPRHQQEQPAGTALVEKSGGLARGAQVVVQPW